MLVSDALTSRRYRCDVRSLSKLKNRARNGKRRGEIKKKKKNGPLTHSAVEAARVPHGWLRVLMIVRRGQVPVGQRHRVLLVPGRRHGGAHFVAVLRRVFDHLLGLAVRCLDEVRHPGSQPAVVRIICARKKKNFVNNLKIEIFTVIVQETSKPTCSRGELRGPRGGGVDPLFFFYFFIL